MALLGDYVKNIHFKNNKQMDLFNVIRWCAKQALPVFAIIIWP